MATGYRIERYDDDTEEWVHVPGSPLYETAEAAQAAFVEFLPTGEDSSVLRCVKADDKGQLVSERSTKVRSKKAAKKRGNRGR